MALALGKYGGFQQADLTRQEGALSVRQAHTQAAWQTARQGVRQPDVEACVLRRGARLRMWLVRRELFRAP